MHAQDELLTIEGEAKSDERDEVDPGEGVSNIHSTATSDKPPPDKDLFEDSVDSDEDYLPPKQTKFVKIQTNTKEEHGEQKELLMVIQSDLKLSPDPHEAASSGEESGA